MRYPLILSATVLAVLMIFGCGSDDDPVTPVTQNVNAYLAALPSWEEFWVTATVISVELWALRWVMLRMPVLSDSPRWAVGIDNH